MLDLPAYLARIGYAGPLEPGRETLRGLHRQHMLTVPFENLDIHLGRPIVLDEARFFDKIVCGRRGGYCYELNGLFAAALRQLGFAVRLHSAGVWDSTAGRFGPEGDHLCLLVQLDEPWLADVGFGDSALEPLRLDERGEQPGGPGRAYRLERDGDCCIMLERRHGGGWDNGYRFSLRPLRLYDFTYANHFMQTSPDTSFTKKRVCTLATPAGRLTLTDYRLIATADGRRTERPVEGESEWRAILREQFGIVLD